MICLVERFVQHDGFCPRNDLLVERMKIASELSRVWLRSVPSYEHVGFLRFVCFYFIL
jgi:hypothetical protein